ncbi:MAG: cyclodeaminase/cyclohydrolase family protein [Phycisphaerales bacterium]|nr:cyclodeaminase/cyclohydrolase family protein [Phycisphaerales bacterium]
MTTDPNQPIAAQTIAEYLDALNSKSPTPGGGAVAGTTGATAAAIAGMVIHYTLGKKKYAEHESDNTERLNQLTAAQSQFLTLADDDAAGYGTLNKLWSLDKSDPKRQAGWADAVNGAITPPTTMLELSVKMMQIVHDLITTTNAMLKSDLAVAAITFKAAAHSAACNIRINIPLLPEASRPDAEASMNESLHAIDTLHDSIVDACR